MPILLALRRSCCSRSCSARKCGCGGCWRSTALDRPDLPGTGGELARHLLDEAGLQQVQVERTDLGDHYDPEARAVRLLPQHHDGRSIAAVAVAAHEVSHAVQHARGEPAFARRFELVKKLIWVERVASGILLLAPVVFMVVKAPIVWSLQVVAGLFLLAIRVVVHVATLAGRVRRELRQGAAGAGARPLSLGRRPAGGPQRAARRGLDLCGGGARDAARCRALVPDSQILGQYSQGSTAAANTATNRSAASGSPAIAVSTLTHHARPTPTR